MADRSIKSSSIAEHFSQAELSSSNEKERRSGLRAQGDGGCIQEWFERQAQLRPGNTALVYGAEQLSYGELNRRANQLAHQLRGLGVGPEVKVALCLERSVEMVVGMLGVLKAGGAYVPFDPSYPVERLRYMLEDSRASVLVAQRGVADELTKQSSKVLFVDSQAQEIGEQSEENPRLTTSGRNLAYVIYTSGSTGQPKGVEIEHGNVTRLFSETQPWFGFGESDVWTLFHSYAFDFSEWEIWGALLFGGKLIIVSYLQSRSPELFYDLLETEGVTVLSQTPSAFRQLIEVDETGTASLDSLRLVILGGEALDPGMLGTWMDRHPRTEIINMYGITEITVHGTYKRMERSDVEGSGSPIGVAIPDLQLYVMDEEGSPVPLGSAGELYVGGAGLARGYLNRPALTAERFVANPFSAKGERLYKSGDRVRQRGDGSFEFLGRIDQQVKIRGYRIELGEIEAVLRQHAGVKQAAVAPKGEGPGETPLVGYIVRDRGAAVTAPELRKHLQLYLPAHMLPAAYVFLDSLPVTSNGKLDRNALPDPQMVRLQMTHRYTPPQTAIEEILCSIWARVLRLDEIGVDDDFFEFGGHSLLATQVVSQVRRIIGVEVPLRSVFESPTIAEFSKIVAEAGASNESAGQGLLDAIEALPADEVRTLLSTYSK